MSQFLFYKTQGPPSRFADKSRFRQEPSPLSRGPVDRGVVSISQPTIHSHHGITDTENQPFYILPPEPTFQRETSSPAIEDDCFHKAQLSDGGESLHSLFSDFTDDRLGDPDCSSSNGLVAPSQCLPIATVPHAETHYDANPAPEELGSIGQPQPVTGSALFDVGRGRLDGTYHVNAQPAISSTDIPQVCSLMESHPDDATFTDPTLNDLAVLDPVHITYTEAGTQTDHPDASLSDRGTQTDQYSMETTHSKEGRPVPVLIETGEIDSFSEQHSANAGNPPCVNATDWTNINFQNIPDLVPTLSGCPHDPIVDRKHCNHPLPVHGFFTIHEGSVGIAYSLTFFESTNAVLSESTDIRTSSPARSDAVQRLPTAHGLAVRRNDGDKDLPLLDPSLIVDQGTRSTSRDESSTQERYISKGPSKGQKRERFSQKEDGLLEQLKSQNLSWKKIGEYFPDRTVGTLQNHYSMKLKPTLLESNEDRKRARTASNHSSSDEEASQQLPYGRRRKRVRTARIYSPDDEGASQQLQCELDTLAC